MANSADPDQLAIVYIIMGLNQTVGPAKVMTEIMI